MSDQLWEKASELVSIYDRIIDSEDLARVIETSESFEADPWGIPEAEDEEEET